MRLKTVARQLKIRRGARPTLELEDEYDFQDLFHSLLRIFFDDIRAEEWVPSYAGGHSRIDFILPAHSVAIELKHSRPSMNARELGDQLIIDIVKYREHKDVRILVCLVFDPAGHISNPVGIETDLTGVNDNYSVWVKILN
ncbi:MAG: hypothetical protein JST89_12145 [Cyanobacteria bacterium SZAS-4]|nr:hypothetical protein [Cyanobacteria bacterium SZAS-4]